MEWIKFAETWAIVILTYLLSTVFFLFIIWGYYDFNSLWNELEAFLISIQLIGAIILIFVPLIGYYLSTFKIVRRRD